jgi:predicted KAP-like P-loop ATPase
MRLLNRRRRDGGAELPRLESPGGGPQWILAADAPIREPDEDRLERIDFARAVAAMVRSAPRHAGFAIGVTGVWGSGKSSVINLALAELEGDGGVELLEFNPWLFSGTEQLVEHFFDELSAQFAESSDRRLQRTAKLLRAYGQVVAPLRLVPGVSAVVKESIEVTRELSEAIAPERPSVREQRARLREQLDKLDRRLVVVVDDLDRLRGDEVVDVMRLIRLVGDFPNLIYLLAFDRRRVEAALMASGSEDGRAFLEKIVQVIQDVPPVRPALVTDLLVDSVFERVGDVGEYRFDKGYFTNLLYGGMSDLFRTLRDINRYANVVPAVLEMVGREIQLADVLALEAIRVFAPDAFNELGALPEALTSAPRAEPAGDALAQIVAAAGQHKEAVGLLLTNLFPAAAAPGHDMHYGPESLQHWQEEGRVAHPDVLDSYLRRRLRRGGARYGLARETR